MRGCGVSIEMQSGARWDMGNGRGHRRGPAKKTAEQIEAEFHAKELKRIERERIETSKPFVHAEKVKEAQAAEAEAKRRATAQAQIDHLIHNYSVNAGPGRIDHGKSDQGRAILRNIKIQRGGKYDAMLTLRVLQ